MVALLLLGLYGVAREAGKLMQLSRDAPSGGAGPERAAAGFEAGRPGAWTAGRAGEYDNPVSATAATTRTSAGNERPLGKTGARVLAVSLGGEGILRTTGRRARRCR